MHIFNKDAFFHFKWKLIFIRSFLKYMYILYKCISKDNLII